MPENNFTTILQLIDDYKFKVKSDLDYIPDFIVDETKPHGQGQGPNPPRLLATAVGHCLSSSLIYCLKKARINIQDLNTTVKTNLFRNENNKLRIKNINIQIHLKIDEKNKTRLPRCLQLFEDYCTVTQSIRKGIEVNIKLK